MTTPPLPPTHDPDKHQLTTWVMDIHCQMMTIDHLAHHPDIPDQSRATIADLCTLLYTSTALWVDLAGALDDALGFTELETSVLIQPDTDEPLRAHINYLCQVNDTVAAVIMLMDTSSRHDDVMTEYLAFRNATLTVLRHIPRLIEELISLENSRL